MVMEYEAGRTEGETDPQALVLRLDGTDGPLAVLYNYTAHALTAGPAHRRFTADYPGVASAAIEDAFPGSVAIFVNGAAGNIHPRECMRDDFAAIERMGAALAEGIIAAATVAEPLAVDAIHLNVESLSFANRVDAELTVTIELVSLRLGRLVVAIMPGEQFVEFQLAFKQALKPDPAMFIAYANDWPGYVPTQASYAEGGYGVDLCTTDPAALSRTALPEGAGERMLEALLAGLGK